MKKNPRKQLFKKVKRVVIKIGSNVIAPSEGALSPLIVQNLVDQIAVLVRSGLQVVIVSSGAIASGLKRLELKESPQSISLKQALAAIGQSHLIWTYEKYFNRKHLKVAQVLLTHEDLSNRERYLNARNTLFSLLNYGVIPIINENDTISAEEIKFGDNDTLSALTAHMIEADLLIILSDVDGLYTVNPREDSSGTLISTVEKITPEIEKLAGKKKSKTGKGGMVTKIEAAKKATASGAMAVIVNGREKNIIKKVLKGEEVGTVFMPISRLKSRKHWITYTLKPKGTVRVDSGAEKALIKDGKSLLPSGIIEIEGNFKLGDPVNIADANGKEFARGLVNFDKKDLMKIKGCHTRDIEKTLGYKHFEEVVHRNNLVLL
jgi:glutamate 5-kinase